MVQTELFKRYIWHTDLIYRNDGITRDEINRCWSHSSVNNNKESEIYLRSLPLHPSQKEVETGADEAKFTMFVQPNYDLIQELLRYGEDVEILRPKWFREEFKKIANKMNQNYQDE